MSKVYSLKRVQIIPTSLQRAWDFFSNPANLEQITGTDMDFKIISTLHGEKMYAGQIIEYYVRPLWGIRWYWMTEITHVEPWLFFVDEQRFGPYSLWHHQHHFKEVAEGVEMTDIIHYKIKGWIFGDLLHRLLIEKKLKSIFDFRKRTIEELFQIEQR